MCIFHHLSGWSKLAERYPAVRSAGEHAYRWQTIQVGPVRFRRCTTVDITPDGLYLRPSVFFRSYAPIVIPWPEIVAVRTAHIYVWETAKELSVGLPLVGTITVTNSLFRLIEPHLRVDTSGV